MTKNILTFHICRHSSGGMFRHTLVLRSKEWILYVCVYGGDDRHASPVNVRCEEKQ